MKSWVLAILVSIVALSGCAIPQNEQKIETRCFPMQEGVGSDGEKITITYACDMESPVAKNASNACVLIDGERGLEGILARDHFQCKDVVIALPIEQVSPRIWSGAGGTVNVRGYHRKDGTYVRPHTRSKAR